MRDRYRVDYLPDSKMALKLKWHPHNRIEPCRETIQVPVPYSPDRGQQKFYSIRLPYPLKPLLQILRVHCLPPAVRESSAVGSVLPAKPGEAGKHLRLP